MYITVSIGNSDNRLTQTEWHNFVNDMKLVIQLNTIQIHFFGGAPNWDPWQNVAWIAELEEGRLEGIQAAITKVRERYKQDSAMVMIGEARFI